MQNRFTLRFQLTLLLFAALLTSCEKKEDNAGATPPPTASGPLLVHDNVRVVDSTKYVLDHDPALLATGTYRFTNAGAALDAPVGSVIVGGQGRGFLRKVTATSTQGNQTTLQTTFASLDELFKSGVLTINSTADGLHQRSAATAEFSHTISNVPVFQNGALSMTLRSGRVTLNPNIGASKRALAPMAPSMRKWQPVARCLPATSCLT